MLREFACGCADATGVHGFAALYRLLGLNERKLSSEKEIRRAYKRAA